jgi:hypothetical protein
MTADQYLHGILLREAVDAGPNSPLLGVQTILMPTLRQWAGDNLLGVYPSGSFRKGTAVHSGTDIDLFLSLSEHTDGTLKEVYNKLFDCLTSAGYTPRRQTFGCEGANCTSSAPHDKATTCFLLELITRLQRMGTAPAIDMAAYARWLVREN